MRSVVEFFVALAVVIGLATAIASSVAPPTTTRSERQARIDELLSRDEVELVDFVAAFGPPQRITEVPCAGASCIRAQWDLSLGSRMCWRRLIVVLNEAERTIFRAQQVPIAPVGNPEEGLRCKEVVE